MTTGSAQVGHGTGERHDGVVLVVTTVHPADDPRIRVRTVGVLADELPVRYAAPPPSPRAGRFAYVPLPGPRPVRALRALREMLRADVGVVSLHDPELVPFGLLARALGRRVVVDVHEDVPAQIREKAYLPGPLRRPIAAAVHRLLRLAERTCSITLAEENYRGIFRRPHPVFANFPLTEALPRAGAPTPGSERPVVYVGDVTTARGAVLAVRAVAAMAPPRPPLVMVGRCREPLRGELVDLAAELGVDLRLRGYLPHHEAMVEVSRAAVGISPLLGAVNHRESLPSKVIEYLAVGIPVVASDLPGTRRVVAGLPGVTLLPPGDVGAWARALDDVYGDPATGSVARDAVDAVRERFGWPSTRVRRHYADLLAQARGAGRAGAERRTVR